MYCPLNDGHIIKEIHAFSQETFEAKVPNFRNQYGLVKLQGTNPFQDLICALPALDVATSDILVFDKVVADYEHSDRLTAFWEKYQMQSSKPSILPPTPRKLVFVVAALMQLNAFWDKRHKAQKYTYTIPAVDAYTKEKLPIKGFRLQDVLIALDKNGSAVSVIIDLGHGIDIRLSDLTAFGPKDLKIRDAQHLYELITATKMNYSTHGTLIAPCIEEELTIPNHLQNINWESPDHLCQVNIDSSEALTKLKLNEKGVEVRAETVAVLSLKIASRVTARPKELTITNGLAVDIRYHDTSIFVGCIPQERFIPNRFRNI